MNLDPNLLSRIAIHGGSGSGKSWFATRLASILGVRAIHLDDLFHGPNWEMRELEAFRADLTQQTATGDWVVDGNYSKIRDIVYQRCTLVIFLRPSVYFSIYQLVKRTMARNLDHLSKYLPFSFGEFTPLPLRVEDNKTGENILLGIYILSISAMKYYFKRYYRDRNWANEAGIANITLRSRSEVLQFIDALNAVK